jgi:hypothetical protein
MKLTKIVLAPKADFDSGGGCDPYFIVLDDAGKEIFNWKTANKVVPWKKAGAHTLETEVVVKGDFQVVFFDQDVGSADDKMLNFWLNTSFIDASIPLVLRKKDLDKANKDKKHEHFPQDFTLAVTFVSLGIPRVVARKLGAKEAGGRGAQKPKKHSSSSSDEEKKEEPAKKPDSKPDNKPQAKPDSKTKQDPKLKPKKESSGSSEDERTKGKQKGKPPPPIPKKNVKGKAKGSSSSDSSNAAPKKKPPPQKKKKKGSSSDS